MVSAQIAGTIKFYRVTPTNARVLLWGGNIAYIGPSGSSEGVIASTPEKWSFIPLTTGADKVLNVNEKLLVTFTSAVTATIGTNTKSKAAIAITYRDGTSDVIGDFSSSVDWDDKQLAAKALVIGDETELCRKTVRLPFALGSNVNKSFTSLENNA